MLSKLALITASDRLYFAYGSNLSPEQMAHRCPDSIFLGKATLPEYRWQVNERGVANVVPVPKRLPQEDRKGGRGRDRNGDGAAVEGLIYAISAEDERQLDLYEGVAKGRYEKYDVCVDFEPVRGNVFARCTSASVARAVREEEGIKREAGVERRAHSWGEGDGDQQRRRQDDRRHQDGGRRRGASVGHPPSSSSSATTGGGWRSSILGLLGIPGRTGRAPSPSPSPARDRERAVGVKPVWALVYASTVHVRDGDIKARYVPRMERAMADAMALGMSRGYVEKQMLPQVRPASRSSRRMSLVGGEDVPEKEKEKGRREGEGGKRRSVYQSDRSGRRGRRDSVVVDRHGDS
ncbi:hypothetical protein LA080_003571 [Diaporthe eres]|nr:hypothetical protein LA080_003571 [Diaporthe eres]